MKTEIVFVVVVFLWFLRLNDIFPFVGRPSSPGTVAPSPFCCWLKGRLHQNSPSLSHFSRRSKLCYTHQTPPRVSKTKKHSSTLYTAALLSALVVVVSLYSIPAYSDDGRIVSCCCCATSQSRVHRIEECRMTTSWPSAECCSLFLDIEYESVCTVRTSKGEETVPRRKMTKTHKSCHQRRWQPVMDVGGNLIHHRPITKLLPLILLLLLTRLQGKKKGNGTKRTPLFGFCNIGLYIICTQHGRPTVDDISHVRWRTAKCFLFFSFLFFSSMNWIDLTHSI